MEMRPGKALTMFGSEFAQHGQRSLLLGDIDSGTHGYAYNIELVALDSDGKASQLGTCCS